MHGQLADSPFEAAQYMSEPKRRWFQIHLSTAVVLMFVAGGMLWSNLREREDDWGYEYSAYTHHGLIADAVITYDYKELFIPVEQRVRYGVSSEDNLDRTNWNFVTPYQSVVLLPSGIAVNAFVAALLLTGAGFLAEWFGRRNDG